MATHTPRKDTPTAWPMFRLSEVDAWLASRAERAMTDEGGAMNDELSAELAERRWRLTGTGERDAVARGPQLGKGEKVEVVPAERLREAEARIAELEDALILLNKKAERENE